MVGSDDSSVNACDLRSEKYEMERDSEGLNDLYDEFQYQKSKHVEIVSCKINKSENNGGTTSCYQLPINGSIKDCDDFVAWRNMNFFQGNIAKAVWTFNTERHSGTNSIRDLNKIIHYAQKQLEIELKK